MALFEKNLTGRCYATLLRRLAPYYLLRQKARLKTQSANRRKQIVMLVSRGHDLDLLVDLYQKAQYRKDLCISLWLAEKCLRREPEILHLLGEKNIHVEMVVDFIHLGRVMKSFISTDAFLSTVESSTISYELTPFL